MLGEFDYYRKFSENYLMCPHCKIVGAIIEEDEGRTNEPENKETNDNAFGLASQRDIDRLNLSRKEGGRGLTSTEDSIDASI